MTSSRWRLAIVAGALLILSTIGAGLAQASSTTAASTAADPVPAAGERFRELRDRVGDRGIGRFGKHFIHGTFTVLDRNGNPITLQLDHGTISAIDDDSISIAEVGGATVTVSTTDETRVRRDRAPATLSALAVGDEVFVTSVVTDGSATARFIVVPAPLPAAD